LNFILKTLSRKDATSNCEHVDPCTYVAQRPKRLRLDVKLLKQSAGREGREETGPTQKRNRENTYSPSSGVILENYPLVKTIHV